MTTYITDPNQIIATEASTCPYCNHEGTKTDNNDPLKMDRSDFKCNNPEYGNVYTIYH